MFRPIFPGLALGLAVVACGEPTSPTLPHAPAPPGPELSVVTFGIQRIGDPNVGIIAPSINDAGQIAGTTSFGTVSPNAFLRSGGVSQILLGVQPFLYSYGNDVNELGVTAGSVVTSATSVAAAVWEGGVVTPLASHYEGGFASADLINNAGRILGTDGLAGSPPVALVWSGKDDPAPTVIQAPAGQRALAIDMNDAGVIVGSIEIDPNSHYAVVWASPAAAPQTLKSFDGTDCAGSYSAGTGINELGEIAGFCQVGDEYHAAFWSGAGALPVDLGQGSATAINELGEIIGSAGFYLRTSLWMQEGGRFRQFNLGAPDGQSYADLSDLNNTGKAIGSSSGSSYATYTWDIPVRATLDAIPGTAGNTIKRDGKGTVSVAILGSRWFRASDVNPASLTLGNDDGVDTPVLRKRSAPVARITDLNRDGFPDLVADFDEKELINRGDLPIGSSVLVLLGLMRDGAHLRGADAVVAR